MAKSGKPVGAGTIEANIAYRIPAFCDALGISRQRLADMRCRGLPIREDGKYRVIIGSDYIDWARSLPANTKGGK